MNFLPIIFDIVALAAKLFPDIVAAIHAVQTASSTTDEERTKALAALKVQLTDDVARVEAVRFRDV